MSSKAKLILSEKLLLNSGLLIETKIWKVPRSEYFPLRLKYRLVLTNRETHEVILLYDNHKPKRPHIHSLGKETKYDLTNMEKLLLDFFHDAELLERQYYENKTNFD